MPGSWRAATFCHLAQAGQQPQDNTEKPRAHGVQRCPAGSFILCVCWCLCLIADILRFIIVLVFVFVLFFYQILVARPEDSGTYICTAQNNQGRSETRVEVIIEGGPQVPTVPRAIVREPLVVVVEGTTTVLHCDAHGKYGSSTISIIWLK